MSKQCILKDIEKLKQANTFLETLFADIEKYKDKEGTSYPIGIPNFSHNDELQINYNEMCIEIMEYFVEKLGDKEELSIGKYFTELTTVSSKQVERMGISRQLLKYHVQLGHVRTVPYGKQKRYMLEDVKKLTK